MKEYITEEHLETDLADLLLGERIPLDIYDSETGEIIIPANKIITKTLISKMVKRKHWIEIDPSPIRNKILSIIEQRDTLA